MPPPAEEAAAARAVALAWSAGPDEPVELGAPPASRGAALPAPTDERQQAAREVSAVAAAQRRMAEQPAPADAAARPEAWVEQLDEAAAPTRAGPPVQAPLALARPVRPRQGRPGLAAALG